MKYVTHARTTQELRAEFVSDLLRRQAALEFMRKNAPSARRAASLALVRQELDAIIEFWQNIELVSSTKKESKP